MRYILLILFLFVVACEESEDMTLSQPAISKSCRNIGQQDKDWYGTQGQVIFNGDCSAQITEGCQTVFTYGDMDFYDETGERGTMIVQVLSGKDWQGCWPVGTHECDYNFSPIAGGENSLQIKCLDDHAGHYFTTQKPEE